MSSDPHAPPGRHRALRSLLAVGSGLAFAACAGDPLGPELGEPGSLAAGLFHTCWAEPTGTTWCWGNNNAGQIGNGIGGSGAVPVQVASDIPFVQVAAGLQHSCALDAAGMAHCWGDNTVGQLGDGTISLRLTPVPVVGGLVFASLRAGGNHTCALTREGIPYCWGENGTGQLGSLHADELCVGEPCAVAPLPVEGGLVLRDLDSGFLHSCGLTRDGVVYCWGANARGQLGNGFFTRAARPVLVTGEARFEQISVGTLHTCALTADGTAYCWGNNTNGELGAPVAESACNGSISCSPRPVPVETPLRFRLISAGSSHTCAVTTDTVTYCWGANDAGQLGVGSVTPSQIEPQRALGQHRFIAIDAGDSHTCGVTAEGRVYCWGDNILRQLGIGDRGLYGPEPIPVAFPEER